MRIIGAGADILLTVQHSIEENQIEFRMEKNKIDSKLEYNSE